MVKISGMDLNVEKSSDGTNGAMWYLYFNEGLFSGPGVSKTVEPSIFRLKKADYDSKLPKSYYMYYNPYINKYNLLTPEEEAETCQDLGYSIGGFIIKNCKLYFVYPKDCEDVLYTRGFAEEYDTSYNKKTYNCYIEPDICGEFHSENFNNDYRIDCIVYGDENGFDVCEFESEEFEADGVCETP
jgi:hypothetical protein